jgi:nucleoid-associated protein YgaU
MGLFDFLRNKGDGVIKEDASAADDIKSHVEANNPGVSGLQVAYQDGVATLTGQADSAEAKEKAVLMAGNIKDVEKVVADGLTAPPAEGAVEFYEIQSGDTLSKLAKQFYGEAMLYTKIFEANREVIRDADLIYPGQKIRIPL